MVLMPTLWDAIRAGDDPDAYIEYYGPGYQEKNWAPGKYSRSDIRNLANAYARLTYDNKHNAVTKDPYAFLANALVENRPGNYGLNDPLPEVEKEMGKYGYHSSDVQYNTTPETYGLRYGLTLAYKTGPYADRVYGKNAPLAKRISLYNGKGSNPTLNANATNHARKVVAMMKELHHPENKAIIDEFNTFSIPEIWGFQHQDEVQK